jgi:hypothetical protein
MQMYNVPLCSSVYGSERLYVTFSFIQTVEMGLEHYSKNEGTKSGQEQNS